MNQNTISRGSDLPDDRLPRIAVVGVSGYAAILLQSLMAVQSNAPFELAAVTAITEPHAAIKDYLAASGCSFHSDYRSMLGAVGSLDLCIVPTSIHWHTRMSVDALRTGSNVLVEKPLAGSSNDGRRIIAAIEQTGKFVAVGFQDLFSSVTREIKSFLLSQELGAVRSIRVSGSWPRSQEYYERNNWSGRNQVDGWVVRDSPINNAFAHFLNLALFFAGSENVNAFPELDSCSGHLYRCYPIETYDTVSIRLKTSMNVCINCVFTHADPSQVEPEIHVQMGRGKLIWRFENEAIAIDDQGEVIKHWCLSTAETSRREMLENVIGCLSGGHVPLCQAEMAMAHCRAIEFIEANTSITGINNNSARRSASFWKPQAGIFESLRNEMQPT